MIVKRLIVVKGFELYASCGAVHQQHGSPVSAIGTQRGRMTALLIAATNQQSAHAGLSHFSEGDLLLVGKGGHAPLKRDPKAESNRAMDCARSAVGPLPFACEDKCAAFRSTMSYRVARCIS
jgi:hypothetical protein